MKLVKKTAQISLATMLAWLVAGVASAQTTTGTTTPGVPNTGAGGDLVLNLFVLAVTGAVALIGAVYLSRKWAHS
jgi:hypothetical protein